MNINLDNHQVSLILDALESYQLDIEHGKQNGYDYSVAEYEIENLTKYLNNTLDKNNTDPPAWNHARSVVGFDENGQPILHDSWGKSK